MGVRNELVVSSYGVANSHGRAARKRTALPSGPTCESDLIARGQSPAQARREARLALGGPEQVKEKCRDARGTRWAEELLQDTGYALRTFRQKPGFVAITLLISGARNRRDDCHVCRSQ